MHGLDCNHLSITIDGSPVNDTGNYACFPGEYLVAELTDHVEGRHRRDRRGQPDRLAVGGQVNVISKVPTTHFGFHGSAGVGSYNYRRGYAELDTGPAGPDGSALVPRAERRLAR